METSTFKRIEVKKEPEFKTAIKFIKDLVKKGIPLSAITTNDWNSSPNTRVYVTIPYGSKKMGGKSKDWKNQFGERALKTALKFWKSRL